MLYRVLKRTIERKNYEAADMQEKLDILFAADRITKEQYQELCGLIA